MRQASLFGDKTNVREYATRVVADLGMEDVIDKTGLLPALQDPDALRDFGALDEDCDDAEI